jgi:hypothetical protein
VQSKTSEEGGRINPGSSLIRCVTFDGIVRNAMQDFHIGCRLAASHCQAAISSLDSIDVAHVVKVNAVMGQIT